MVCIFHAYSCLADCCTACYNRAVKSAFSQNKTTKLPTEEPTQRIYDLDRTRRILWIPPTNPRLGVTAGGGPKQDRRLAWHVGGAIATVLGCLLLLFLWPKGHPSPPPVSTYIRSDLPQAPAAAPHRRTAFIPTPSVATRTPPLFVTLQQSPASAQPASGSHFLVAPAAPRPSEENSR